MSPESVRVAWRVSVPDENRPADGFHGRSLIFEGLVPIPVEAARFLFRRSLGRLGPRPNPGLMMRNRQGYRSDFPLNEEPARQGSKGSAAEEPDSPPAMKGWISGMAGSLSLTWRTRRRWPRMGRGLTPPPAMPGGRSSLRKIVMGSLGPPRPTRVTPCAGMTTSLVRACKQRSLPSRANH